MTGRAREVGREPGTRSDPISSSASLPIESGFIPPLDIASSPRATSETSKKQAEHRVAAIGSTWTSCPLLIALLSVPTFAAMTSATKGLAPTRLRLTGAAIGLASGGIAAAAYSLHCEEMAAPFLGSWYVAGLLIPAVLGLIARPRLLRW